MTYYVMKKEKTFDVKSTNKKKQYLKIPTAVLGTSDSIELNLERTSDENEIIIGRNSRCVSVDTFLSAPLVRRV